MAHVDVFGPDVIDVDVEQTWTYHFTGLAAAIAQFISEVGNPPQWMQIEYQLDSTPTQFVTFVLPGYTDVDTEDTSAGWPGPGEYRCATESAAGVDDDFAGSFTSTTDNPVDDCGGWWGALADGHTIVAVKVNYLATNIGGFALRSFGSVLSDRFTPSIVAPSAVLNPTAWELRITQRDGTLVHSFTSSDSADEAPIITFEGQDTTNEIGPATLALPAEHDANAYLVEDDLLHLFDHGEYVTSFVIGVPIVGVVEQQEELGEQAVWSLRHLLSITEEGIVEPPSGMDFQPAAADRAFNFAAPQLDDSAWIASTGLAHFGGDTLIDPIGWPAGSAADFIWSQDYDLSGGFHNHPLGTSYFRDTFTVGGGDNLPVRVFVAVDDNFELWIDDILIESYIGVGVEGWTRSHPNDLEISPGVHTIAIKGTNIDRPTAPNNYGWVKFSVWTIIPGSTVLDTELVASSTGTLCVDYPATPPGFNGGEILLVTSSEEQTQGVLLGVVCSFDSTNDSDGTAWPAAVDVGTKSLAGLEQFWLRELTAALVDIDAHFDFDTGSIVLDAWVKGTHHPASSVTLTEGDNLAELSVPQARRVMSQAVAIWNQSGHLAHHAVTAAPPAGRPAKRRAMSLGAAHSVEQVERDATSQIDLFNRQRQAPTLAHVISDGTPNSERPPAYWKWSTVTIAVTSRWLDAGEATLAAVSFQLVDGRMVYVPEAGDIIIPPAAQAGVVLRKMAAPMLGGQAKPATPL